MASSYKDIDYRVRPAKTIERKMLCSAFRKLTEFGVVKYYQYVGFGSTYFSDFKLFHRELGLTRMYSIEQNGNEEKRFRFNKPYNCIELIFGHSNDKLSEIDWDNRSIAWLDYEKPLNQQIVTDISYLSSQLKSGSMLIITVNAEPDKFDPNTKRREKLKDRIDERYVHDGLKDKDLGKWGTAKFYRKTIDNIIWEKLRNRNSAIDPENKIQYQQLFNFHYQDGTKMLTTGGIFYGSGHENLYKKCDFESLDFVRKDETSKNINTPKLTPKEVRYLNAKLPQEEIENIENHDIPEQDIKAYESSYRYYPSFTETEI